MSCVDYLWLFLFLGSGWFFARLFKDIKRLGEEIRVLNSVRQGHAYNIDACGKRIDALSSGVRALEDKFDGFRIDEMNEAFVATVSAVGDCRDKRAELESRVRVLEKRFEETVEKKSRTRKATDKQ
ncbi:MAG: hypothetical protein IK077_08610 [Thermoguttaceae bacterium]|nr:hypothetical protein [Thermoguttaceae bacterium]